MGLFVVVLLAALWMSMLLPDVHRMRRERSAIDSARSFQRTMSMLAHKCGSPSQAQRYPSGRHVLVLNDAATVTRSAARSRMRQRQRAVSAQLAAAVFVTGVLAVVAGGALWSLFSASVAAFTTYALLVAHVRAREAEQREKVRDIKRAKRPAPAARAGSAGSNVHIRRRVG